MFFLHPSRILKNKSEKVFNIFSKTAEKLLTINDSIDVQKAVHATEIAWHQAHHDNLDEQHAKNEKLIKKVTSFLES